MIRAMFTISIVLMLSACSAPYQQLALPKAAWQGYSAHRKAALLQAHQSVLKIRQAQAKKAKIYAGPDISVYIYDGTAKMPPYTSRYHFSTVRVRFKPGQCQDVALTSIDTNHHVLLNACYDGLQLALDPSPYRLDAATGSLFFPYNPLWRRGMTYDHLSSQGRVALKDASLTIKALG